MTVIVSADRVTKVWCYGEFMGTDEIHPPVFVWSDDLLVFESAEAAGRYLEPVDVREASDEAFDARGRVLRVSVEPRRHVLGTTEQVVVHPTDRFSETRLTEILRDYYLRVGRGRPDELSRLALEDLVEIGRRLTSR